jgi:group I intron endonuclease
MEITMTCGIYLIKNIWSGKTYVGSSVNIETRWKTHIYRLNSGKHPASKLVNAWKKYGIHGFEFRILEEIEGASKAFLLLREQYWIDTTFSHFLGYNTRPDARSCHGYKRGTPSEAHKAKNAAAHTGANNPNFGKPRSEETKRKISEAQKGKSRPLTTFSPESRKNRSEGIKRVWAEGPNREDRIKLLDEARKKKTYRQHSEETKEKMRGPRGPQKNPRKRK